MHPFRSAGVVGTARKEGDTGNRGRPVAGEGSGAQRHLGVAARRRESDSGNIVCWGSTQIGVGWESHWRSGRGRHIQKWGVMPHWPG